MRVRRTRRRAASAYALTHDLTSSSDIYLQTNRLTFTESSFCRLSPSFTLQARPFLSDEAQRFVVKLRRGRPLEEVALKHTLVVERPVQVQSQMSELSYELS